MTVRALIVDDERIARDGLRELLDGASWIECVGEAADGPAALRAIHELQPDVVFLDIQLPGLFGTEVLTRVTTQPHVVFTTAFAEYAVTAFELNALDYLLKPFGRERFANTLEKVRAAVGEPQEHSPLRRAVEGFADGPVTRFFVRQGVAIIPVPVEAVIRFEARGDYVAVHAEGGRYLIHLTMTRVESRLDPERFVRIHRKHIVNLDWVEAFKPHDTTRLRVELRDGTKLVVSRSKSQELRQRGV